MITNCVNCGAPVESDKKECPYCKTPYGFRAKIEFESYIDSNGRFCRSDNVKIIESVEHIGGNEPEMVETTTLGDSATMFIEGRRRNV